MKSLFFGTSGRQFHDGEHPDCAINTSGTVVGAFECKDKEGVRRLCWMCGQADGVDVYATYGGIRHYTAPRSDADIGVNPTIALNDSGLVLEVHNSDKGQLYYWSGKVSNAHIAWLEHDNVRIQGHAIDGYKPAVAISNSGAVVEVHQSAERVGELWYLIGFIGEDAKVHWSACARVGPSGHQAKGNNPAVAISNAGIVIEVHDSGDDDPDPQLHYSIGKLSQNSIDWLVSGTYDSGRNPSVALSDSGDLIEVHEGRSSDRLLWQRIGVLHPNRATGYQIEWLDPLHTGKCGKWFDNGLSPAVAFNGRVALQLHKSHSYSTIWGTSAFWFDRSTWLQDALPVLQHVPLRRLVLPATHDSANYLQSASEKRHQDLWIISQLMAGVRFFDMRLGYNDGKFVFIEHDADEDDKPGQWPTLDEVLQQIRDFAQVSGDLVIFQFSNWGKNIRDKKEVLFSRFCQEVYASIGDLLCDVSVPSGQRLADVSLGSFLQSRGNILVLCQYSYAPPPPPSGTGAILRSQSANSSDPQHGDITILGPWSNMEDYLDMSSDQLAAFKGFTGWCNLNYQLVCDLYALGWLLTPQGVADAPPPTNEANKRLSLALADVGANSYGRTINLLQCDMIEFARACDVAVLRNGCVEVLTRGHGSPR